MFAKRFSPTTQQEKKETYRFIQNTVIQYSLCLSLLSVISTVCCMLMAVPHPIFNAKCNHLAATG